MNVTNLIKIALKAMARNKTRTFLTMLGIIIGVTSVITMLAIGEGSKTSIQGQISNMGTNMIIVFPSSDAPGGVRQEASATQTLEIKDVELIMANAEHVSAVSPAITGRGQVVFGSNNWPTTMQGVSPDFTTIRKMEVEQGIMFSKSDVHAAAKVAVIGQTVVENLFPTGESPIGKTIRFKSIPFKVIGILKEKGENTFGQDQDDIILTPYTTLQKRVLAITHVQNIYASAANEDVTELAVAEISSILRESHMLSPNDDDDFVVRSQKELLSTFTSTSQLLTVLLAAISGISLLVGGIGIMNIMFVSVTERTREIGLRMAIGGKGVDILTQFLMEAVIVSVGGGLIGILFGLGIAYFVSGILNWPVTVTNSSIFISFLVCAIVGVFFGWYPARKAANLDPIEALRYE